MKAFRRYLWILAVILISFQGCSSKEEVDKPKEDVSVTETAPTPTPKSNLADVSEVKNAMTKKENKSKLHYSPAKYNMWDSWIVDNNGEFHLVHLKGLAGGVTYDSSKEDVRGYGHATSTDLLHWTEQEDILEVDKSKNPYDQEFRYTGCTIEHEGVFYTYYTMRKGQGQRIGVATSKDMYEWEEYEGNPVLVPDEQWFVTFANENVSNNAAWGGTVDCRDMVVIKDEEGDGFWGYFVASAEHGMTTPTAVVGVAYSTNLLDWEQKGIAYTPTAVAMPEMFDVFKIGDKWYMTLTTAKNNGCINGFSDPYVTRAQIYAVADSPMGPFVENPDDNVMMGGQICSGYSSRSIVFNGIRRVLYVDYNNGTSVLSLPKNVDVNEDGYLRLYYASDLLQSIRTRELNKTIAVQSNTSFAWNTKGGVWKKDGDTFACTTDPGSWQSFLMRGIDNNLELEFVMDAESTCSSLGIVLSNKGDGKYLNDLNHILAIDMENNRVYLTNAEWDLKNCKEFVFQENIEYHFRMLLIDHTIELYINDELVFNSSIYNEGGYRTGLFVNDGTIVVNDLKLFALE